MSTSSGQALEEALLALTRPSSLAVHGAGRTDAGVHALGQVAHVDLKRDWRGWRLREAINAHLAPQPIAVIEAEPAADDFDARRRAVMRHYLYRIVNRRAPLTLERGRAWRVKREADIHIYLDAQGHLHIFFVGDGEMRVLEHFTHHRRGRLPPLPEILAIVKVA